MSPSLDIIAGAMLVIAASIFNAIGYTVQKKGHNQVSNYNQDENKCDKKTAFTNKIWLIGFMLYLIGGILNIIALFYAPQSLVLPLSAITLVFNTLLATNILNEPFYKTDAMGILCVITGSILAVMYGPRNTNINNINELKMRWIDCNFCIFFVILTIIIIIDFIFVKYFECARIKNIKLKSLFLLISYCILSGYCGSLSFLFLKSFTEFISICNKSIKLYGINNGLFIQFKDWYIYIIIFGIIFSNLLLELFRQKGLKYFNVIYIVPINQVILIIMGTIIGGLYFKEFYNMKLINCIVFIIAIGMTIIGVFILALNSGKSTDESEDKIGTKTTPSDLSFINEYELTNLEEGSDEIMDIIDDIISTNTNTNQLRDLMDISVNSAP